MQFAPLRHALFAIDAERAHDLTVRALAVWPRFGAPFAPDLPTLPVEIAGLTFPNPIGLAAGADKNARAVEGWFALGFGAVEVGTLTPLPQPGNPRPRLFRLPDDRAVVNRLGFNNAGLPSALPRLASRSRAGRLGINVGANKDATDRIADYVTGVTIASQHADYVTINISSPNTPGLRDLQHGAALSELLTRANGARVSSGRRVPLFLKVAPDLTPADIDAIARAAIDSGVDALIVSNTTLSRPALRSAAAGEAGGLSGAPLAPLARQRLVDFREATGGAIPLISVGGIGDADEVYARIRAGASLVQIYTALVYEGPGLPARLVRGLAERLRADGFASVSDAVGAG